MTLQASGPISFGQIQTEFGGANPISMTEYYGRSFGIPASGLISASHFYGKSAVIPFPDTGGAPSVNYDFYLNGPYQSLMPLRVVYSRSGTGPVSYSLTSYNQYCGNNPTVTGTATLNTMLVDGKTVEYFDLAMQWNKGCCNGNNNNIYVTVRITMTPSGNISSSLLSSSQDGQWGC